MSESEILAAESANAREAIRQALDELKASLSQSADIRLWTKKHPWASVGIAAAAGFAAATAITPRSDQSVQDKLSEFTEAIHTVRAATPQRETTGNPGSPTFYQSLLVAVFDLAQVAIAKLIMAVVQRQTATPSMPDETDSAASPTPDDRQNAEAAAGHL